ncbi:MAG: polyphosphate polymerase domain-containing protein [Caldilineaceae bacterium]
MIWTDSPPAGVYCERSYPPAARLGSFETITLTELNSMALLDRIEVKYLLPIRLLDDVLLALRPNYAALTIGDRQLSHYRTLYFDTADMALYRRHHMGARNRYKVRAREYVESHVTYLEIKHKTNSRRTVKSRLPTRELITGMNRRALEFLRDKCPYNAVEFAPALWNTYARATLASKANCERVTLDINLGFAWEGRKTGLPAVAVAEVKRDSSLRPSDFIALMRRMGIRKAGFSKYCVGVSLLYPGMKHNRFRAAHRLIERLSQGGQYAAA